MKRKLLCLLLALLLLTGCTPPAKTPALPGQSNQSPNTPSVENVEPSEKDSSQSWDYDIGTTINDVLGLGTYAMADDLVYFVFNYGRNIMEYDVQSRVGISLSLPEGEMAADLSSSAKNGICRGNIFLLEEGVAFILDTSKNEFTRDALGNVLEMRRVTTSELAMRTFDNDEFVKFPQFGDQVRSVVPVRKDSAPDMDRGGNPLAGFDFYFTYLHDTFPEMAEQMAEMGVTLEEPTDENVRNGYYITALAHVDGDTGEKTVLARNVQSFYVTEDTLYYSSNTMGGVIAGVKDKVYYSDRKNIDFQPADWLDGPWFEAGSDGLYRKNSEGVLCRYVDRTLVETAVTPASGPYTLWGDKLVVAQPEFGQYGPYYARPWAPIWIYDLETGEGHQIADHYDCGQAIQVLQDRYLAYREYAYEYEAYVLLDMETGERIEMYRKDRNETEIQKEKEFFEKSFKRSEETYKKWYEEAQQKENDGVQ